MKVSILTVCHNQLTHTKRFISSLRRFTPLGSWNLLAIDSGSSEEEAEGLRKLLTGENERVLNVIENIGWVRGINLGLQYIPQDTDIVIFANNDVVLDKPGWLERLCSHFDNPTVGAVGPTSNYVIGKQNISFNVPHVQEEDTNTLIGFFFAVRKEIVDEIGGLDESLSPGGIGGGDDHDYSIRIRRAGWRLVVARDVFVWHSGSKSFMEKLGPEGYNKHWRACDKALEAKWGELETRQLFESPLKIAFGLPMRGWHPHWKFAKSLIYLQKPLSWHMVEANRCVVDQGRNQIVQVAQKHGINYLLFLDDDHTFPSDLLYRLLSHGKDVVGALCFRRVAPFGPCLFSWETERTNGNLMVFDRPDLIRKGLQKVDAIGFGAVLVKMEVFEKLGPPPWFKFTEVGEDLHFCSLCAEKGIDIFCDTDLIAPHIVDDGIEVDEKVFFEHHQYAKKGTA